MAVIVAMASFGFAIGSGLIVATGVDWDWLAVLAGLVAGAAVGVASILLDVPMIVLIVLGSVAGAISATAGVMLLVGSLNSADFTRAAFTDSVKGGWGWYLLLLVPALAGIIVQARQRVAMHRTIHDHWYTESR